jgi:hypothetical protein
MMNIIVFFCIIKRYACSFMVYLHNTYKKPLNLKFQLFIYSSLRPYVPMVPHVIEYRSGKRGGPLPADHRGRSGICASEITARNALGKIKGLPDVITVAIGRSMGISGKGMDLDFPPLSTGRLQVRSPRAHSTVLALSIFISMLMIYSDRVGGCPTASEATGLWFVVLHTA